MGLPVDMHFHEQIRRQGSLVDASLVLGESATALGWDRVAFVGDIRQLGLPRDTSGDFLLSAIGWSQSGLEAWVRMKLGRHCPVAQHCYDEQDPFAWDCSNQGAQWQGRTLEPEQRQVLDHYGQQAVGGLTVPVHRRNGRVGYVSWLTRDRSRLRQRCAETLSATHLFSHAFMHQYDRHALPESEPNSSLTPREIECLHWAARGKTAEETSIIIQRSRETVQFHLRNAVIKLGASNRSHAVAIACSRGLVSV
ncbi:helix-turn-helix transcriptional regulator [Hydrocarboniphaga sp.]|uniref:helix-turn-helix transcriptional regulator n=1 Tax=Hydrocarboniphaga sp. TaxID=2033016 RepID=UPI003D0F6EFA